MRIAEAAAERKLSVKATNELIFYNKKIVFNKYYFMHNCFLKFNLILSGKGFHYTISNCWQMQSDEANLCPALIILIFLLYFLKIKIDVIFFTHLIVIFII